MLNSTELLPFVNAGIVDDKQIQQVSIDLRVDSISMIEDGNFIGVNGNKLVSSTDKYDSLLTSEPSKGQRYQLLPGFYRVDFEESIIVPSNKAFQVIHRSSLLRSGTLITSAIYDPGFKGKLGAFMIVNHPITIEKGARIACLYGFDCRELETALLYNGQYQNQ